MNSAQIRKTDFCSLLDKNTKSFQLKKSLNLRT